MKALEGNLTQKVVVGKKWIEIKKNISLYILIAPLIISTVIFAYLPMPGIIISFMEYDIFKGFNSPWTGFDNIKQIIAMPSFFKALCNTLQISGLNLLIVFPMPIIFAVLLNEVRKKGFKRLVQTASYLPYFLSWISVVGIAYSIYGTYGIINDVRIAILGEQANRIMFLSKQGLFLPNIILLTLWKNVGWSSVIYLATISGIDSQLYEAAEIDGAGKLKQCQHVTLPCLLPTAVMLFILQIGRILDDNMDLIYGLQNPFIDFETISTLVYKNGIAAGKYSVSTAIGFMQGGIGFVLVIIANYFSKKVNDVSLW